MIHDKAMRENPTPFGEVYATLDDAIQHMETAQTAYAVLAKALARMTPAATSHLQSTDAYKGYWKQLAEIGQARDAVMRAITLLQDIERTAEEANND
jgi:hypothetical protein